MIHLFVSDIVHWFEQLIASGSHFPEPTPGLDKGPGPHTTQYSPPPIIIINIINPNFSFSLLQLNQLHRFIYQNMKHEFYFIIFFLKTIKSTLFHHFQPTQKLVKKFKINKIK